MDNNLGYFSAAAARAGPQRTAVIDLCEGERTVTYAELEERMERAAGALAARGLEPGARVALCVGNRVAFLDAMFGAMRAGLVPVPLNTRQGGDVLAYIMADANCVAAIVEPATNPHIVERVEAAGIGPKLAIGDIPPGWEDYEAALDAAPKTFDPPAIADDHVAFQPYTSGSTGKPKGVILTHAGQLWWIRALQRHFPVPPDTRALTAMPLYHKNAFAGAIKPMLQVGGSAVVLPGFEPRRVIEALAHYRVNRSGGVPAAFSMMLRHRDLIRSLDFSALETLVIGSAPVAKELADQIEDAFGVTVGESYGLTEGGPVMLGPPPDGQPVPHGSCGVAWPEGEVRLVDADGRDHESDGELWVKNRGVTPGYHNLPEVNAKRLADGWLKTGDLFHRDADGFFYFRGRTDDMFTSGGENVYPKEVEDLLLAHDAVVDACVVPVPHAVKGEVPVALVMLTAPDAATPETLKAHTLEHGPAYAHPREILVVDAIPLNGAGKNDRTVVARQMRERFAALAEERA